MTGEDHSKRDAPPERILFEIRDNIAVVTLNRPQARNALDDAMRGEFVGVLDRIASDDSIRAVVLTGAGTAFCAGGDIKSMQQRLSAPAGKVAINGWRRQRRTHHAVTSLHALDKPTIAAVNGPAAGLGCDLALACDFVMASSSANFQMSYVLRGLVPDGGGLYFLPRRVGLARAKELFLSARRVAADEAVSIGLADRMTSPDKLVADAVQWARDLSKGSGPAISLTKTLLDNSLESSFEEICAMGAEAQAICYTTDEHRESVAAFLKKD